MDSNSKACERAILKTLIYSDIFNFPLTKDELWRFLISDKKIDKTVFEKIMKKRIPGVIKKNATRGDNYETETFYYLSGREKIVERRLEHMMETHHKLRIAKTAAHFLSLIPTVYFIGISGSTAIGNAGKNDDIDLFIITKKHTLFTTRLWILMLLELLNLRRKRHEYNPVNKICVNLLIDEQALLWPPHKHDLFVAHEIVQLKPLFERNGIYKQFIQSNSWIKKYFPNALQEIPFNFQTKKTEEFYTLQAFSWFFNLLPVAYFVRFIQKVYMHKHRSTELISNHMLAFHPHDYRKETLQLFHHKTGLLTNI